MLSNLGRGYWTEPQGDGSLIVRHGMWCSDVLPPQDVPAYLAERCNAREMTTGQWGLLFLGVFLAVFLSVLTLSAVSRLISPEVALSVVATRSYVLVGYVVVRRPGRDPVLACTLPERPAVLGPAVLHAPGCRASRQHRLHWLAVSADRECGVCRDGPRLRGHGRSEDQFADRATGRPGGCGDGSLAGLRPFDRPASPDIRASAQTLDRPIHACGLPGLRSALPRARCCKVKPPFSCLLSFLQAVRARITMKVDQTLIDFALVVFAIEVSGITVRA